MTYETTDVFTPTVPAKLTFVERQSINDQLVSALKTPGKQIVVYGYSGSGKTTLLTRKLEQVYEHHLKSQCTGSTKFEDLLINAFESLESFYTQERKFGKRHKASGGLEVQLLRIKSQLGAERESSEETKTTRLVPPQLTPQTLAKLLGEIRGCWLLEDFHKVAPSEKVKLAQCLKVFTDMADLYPEVKIIAIGAVDTAREVVQYDAEMRNRVSEIAVPLMTERELSEIIKKGADCLNVAFDHEVVENTVWFSNGLASACHGLCLYACETAGIGETSNVSVRLNDTHFRKALARFVSESSDSLKFAFEKAFRPSKRTKFDNYRIVVRALAAFEQQGATKARLYAKILENEKQYTKANLNHCLNQLAAEDRGGIIRYSKSSGYYSFAEPVFRMYALTTFKEEKQRAGPREYFTGVLQSLAGDWKNHSSD